MAIRVLSIDFNNCVFFTEEPLKASVDFLYEEIISGPSDFFSKNIVLNNIYSQITDNTYFSEREERISVSRSVQELVKQSDARYIPFQLAQLFDGPSAITLARMRQKLTHENTSYLNEQIRLFILYAQIHKIALEQTSQVNECDRDCIEFYFYDANQLVIQKLHQYFYQHSFLLPTHVRLHLHHLVGCNDGEYSLLQGTGFVDVNYQQTVIEMLDGVMASETLELINPQSLTQRSPLEFKITPLLVPVITPPQITSPELTPAVPNDSILSAVSQLPGSSFSFFSSDTSTTNYLKIWNQTQQSDLERAKALLKDYTKENTPFGSFLGNIVTGHWKRSHIKEVSSIIAKEHPDLSRLIIDLLALEPTSNGSLRRRIDFIKKQIGYLEIVPPSVVPHPQLKQGSPCEASTLSACEVHTLSAYDVSSINTWS